MELYSTTCSLFWRIVGNRSKVCQKTLIKIFGCFQYNYEQFLAFLTQIEACLNSRPLTLESNDPNEPSSLIPGHFLIGGPLTALPNPDLTQIPISHLKHWELVSKQVQDFWNRWRLEYLNDLQQR